MIYVKKNSTFSEIKTEFSKGEYKRFQSAEGYSLLKTALKSQFNIEFSMEMLDKTQKGKPYLRDFPDIFFNISHCDGLVVCAVGNSEQGVDAEPIKPVRKNVVARCFSENEQKQLAVSKNPDLLFTRLWTLKESYVKFTGTGIAVDMCKIEFNLEKDIDFSLDKAGFTQIILDNSYVISNCNWYIQNNSVTYAEYGEKNEIITFLI